MKKADAESGIRQICWEYSRAFDIPMTGSRSVMPSYMHFKDWAHKKGYGRYFQFRTVGDSDDIVEQWFDEEFKQTWRN